GVRVVPEGDGEAVLEPDQPGHGVGAGAVHADLAVVIDAHEAEGAVHGRVHHRQVEPVGLGDRLPVGDRGAAQRIDADLHLRVASRLQIDHVGQVADVGRDVVVLVRGARLQGRLVALAADAGVVGLQQLVGAALDPGGDVGVGRAAVGRVVLEAPV